MKIEGKSTTIILALSFLNALCICYNADGSGWMLYQLMKASASVSVDGTKSRGI